MNYFQNPYQMPFQQMQSYQVPHPQPQIQPSPGLIWVRSQAEAEQYMMVPNSAVTLWDINSPAIYLKKTDASGRPEFKAYDLVERTAPPQAANSATGDFVTRKEFEDVLRQLFPAKGKYEKEDSE